MKATVNARACRTAVVVGICLGVAILHLILGGPYRGPWPTFVKGYLFDVFVPFALYFLLCQLESKHLSFRWQWKVALIVGFGSAIELAQLAELPLFGSTFDLFDILAYAVGAMLAAVIDKLVLSRWLGFWTIRP